MGCAASKLEQQPAVALCRDRCNLIDQALRQSHVFADAHAAYMQSLKSVGVALLSFSHYQIDHALSRASFSSSQIYSKSDSVECVDKVNNESIKECLKRMDSVKPSNSRCYWNDSYECSVASRTDKNESFGGFSESEASPPPPPAPSSSAWDFLNFFEIDNMFGLPDVGQFECTESGVGSEEVKFVGESCDGNVKVVAGEKDVGVVCGTERPQKEECGDGLKNAFENGRCKRGVSEVMSEIQVLFDRAAESGNDILGMLGGANFYFYKKSPAQQVSSKMFRAFSPSLSRVSSKSATPKNSESSPFSGSIESSCIGFDEDLGFNLSSLSSTLKQLCMWEKKLYDEVRVEGKLCMTYQTKSRQLKHLVKKGAKPRKVEEMQNLLKSISTKIKVAIQVVDKLSDTVKKLREEELWPCIREFIQGLYEMWKVISECHKSQSQAVADANNLDDILCNGKLTDASFEAALHLKYELQNWSLSFSNWIRSQKDFVRYLNNWAQKCLLDKHEETHDRVVSLSRRTVSPVQLICNRWSQVMSTLSEKETTENMKCLFLSVDKLLKQHYADIQQRVDIDIILERKLKNMVKAEQKYQRIMQARLKKMPLTARESDLLVDTESEQQTAVRISSSSQSMLELIFEALNKFTTNYIQVYEELTSQIKVCQHANT